MNKDLIIFVCTGNTCRRPMAEALFRNGLTVCEREQLEVKSYGLSVLGSDPASKHAITVMADRGIDISTHRSTPLTYFAVNNAKLIVCMTESHSRALLSIGVPIDKIITLNVSDPFGGTEEDYRRCADEIEKKLEVVYARIRQH